MAGEDQFDTHTMKPTKGPNGSTPKEHTVGADTPAITPLNQLSKSQVLCDLDDPMMQFVVQNFNQINAMYFAFSSKGKEIYSKQLINDPNNHTLTQSWDSHSEKTSTGNEKCVAEGSTLNSRPHKKNRGIVILEGQKETHLKKPTCKLNAEFAKHKPVNDNVFYNKPFVFDESKRNVRDLVVSLFTKRIRDYEMLEGLQVPSNLKSYDGLSDADDHLSMFMGTMDVHKLPEPAWCRIFNITLCGAARFWNDNIAIESIDGFHQLRDKFGANFLQQRQFKKTQAEILGFRQRSDENLKDYLARFRKESLHMTNRSDGIMIGAFISKLRSERLYKDLIALPPTSLEDLYIEVNSFLRADDANNENRLRESMG